MQLFLGLTDSQKEKTWRWDASGIRARYTRFQHGEPNGGTLENCVIMEKANGRWADVRCSTKLRYHVCEKPTQRSTHHHVSIGNIPTKFTRFYKVMGSIWKFFTYKHYIGYLACLKFVLTNFNISEERDET